ncbi:hypothetical protein DL770_005945 [Monosporascus sp. CRB-9-2]|nr:hypothetical protein DL770_005945 [Monosporascus sp. CRB-9-2]
MCNGRIVRCRKLPLAAGVCIYPSGKRCDLARCIYPAYGGQIITPPAAISEVWSSVTLVIRYNWNHGEIGTFVQTLLLPAAPWPWDAGLDIYRTFADLVQRSAPGCLKFTLCRSQDNSTGSVDAVVFERTQAQDALVTWPPYLRLLHDRAAAQILREK